MVFGLGVPAKTLKWLCDKMLHDHGQLKPKESTESIQIASASRSPPQTGRAAAPWRPTARPKDFILCFRVLELGRFNNITIITITTIIIRSIISIVAIILLLL